MFQMKPPVISYIIPVFNSRETIEKCIQSIRSQSSKESYEVIVVDNNSPIPDLFQILKKLDVQIIKEKKQGPSAARNRGIREAQGKYLAFLDADIVLEKNWAEECLKKIETLWIDCVQSPIYPGASKNKNFMGRFRYEFIGSKTRGTYNYLNHAEEAFPVLNSAAFMIKAETLKNKSVSFDESLLRCEDTDFGYQLLFSGCHFSTVTTSSATVFDNRTAVEYLKRSLHIGYSTSEVQKKWRGKSSLAIKISQMNQKWFSIQPEELFIKANLAAAFLGQASGFVLHRFSKGQKAKLQFALKSDLRNRFFLHSSNEKEHWVLSPWVRIVHTDKNIVFIHMLSGKRISLKDKESSEILKMAESCKGENYSHPPTKLFKKLVDQEFMVNDETI